MNRRAKTIIDLIGIDISNYKLSVAEALMKYRAERDRANKEKVRYVDQQQEYNRIVLPAQAQARNAITAAGKELSGNLKARSKALHEILRDAMTEPIGAAFVNKLRLYIDLGLKPSRTEAQAMIDEAKKSPAALRAISAMLVKVDAPFRLKTLDVERLESDLHNLDVLAANIEHVPAFTYDDIQTGAELFKGQKRMTVTSNGAVYDGGRRIEMIDLTMATAEIKTSVEAITDNKGAWQQDVSTALEESIDREMYRKEVNRAEAEAEINGTEPVYPERPESTVTLEGDGTSLARKMGRELAEANAKAEGVKHYAR